MPPNCTNCGRSVRIGKRFEFSAAHCLPASPDDPDGLAPDHPYTRPHGHNYVVEVILEACELTLVGPGFVTELGALDPFASYLKEHLDHRNLNEVLPAAPTCELMALHFADWLEHNLVQSLPGNLAAVRVSDTPATWAECIVLC